MAIAKDPVCGMDVEESKAAATSEYNGKKYYFNGTGWPRNHALGTAKQYRGKGYLARVITSPAQGRAAGHQYGIYIREPWAL